MPSICIPPWAGGVSPPNVVHEHEEHVPRNAADAKAKVHLHSVGSQRNRTRAVPPTAVCRMILGTSMTCSTSGKELSKIFSTSITESTSCGSGAWRSGTTGALHDAPRDSLLRPGHAKHPVQPRAPEHQHAIVVEEEVLRARLLGGGFFQNSAV